MIMTNIGTQCLGVQLGHPFLGVIHMVSGPPVWGLDVGLTAPPDKKNCLLGNQKCGLGPKVWRRSITEAKARIGLSANEEEEIKI